MPPPMVSSAGAMAEDGDFVEIMDLNSQMIKVRVPKLSVIYPIFDRVVYPGSGAQLPFSEKFYHDIGSPPTVALFMVKQSVREEFGKTRDTFTLTSTDQLNPIGLLVHISQSASKSYIIGAARISILEDENVDISLETPVSPLDNTTTTAATEGDNNNTMSKVMVKRIKLLHDKVIEESQQTRIRALTLQLVKKVKYLSTQYPESQFSSQFQMMSGVSRFRFLELPGKFADYISSICSDSPDEYQEIVESLDVDRRLEKVLSLIVKQIQLNEFNALMEKHIEEKAVKQQKKFFLGEQMKLVRKELGLDQDEKETLKKKFAERWSKLIVHDEQARQVFKDEMERLSGLDPSSSEYNVTRNYLEWITSLPWDDPTSDNFDIPTIKQVLDDDHYGLEDIKEMIQTFIAVGKLTQSVGGKIILLVGPPGTGKTSIGKSIATALGRQFYRFSVGGISDVAEIKGHRRTFIGAMPGKIIQALKMVKKSNPVILIDEIDKISKGFQSDPYASLLEVFDPQQNKNFLDHYLDIPYDLSKVLFICTANLTHTIPAPLLDRMDVMKLNGYIQSEQIQIAEKYLVPAVRKETGISEEQVNISTEAIKHLCEYWCRESGVRNLKKMIERIFRKIAYKMATEDPKQIVITSENMEEYAGLPKYRINKYYQTPQVGITLGLGWSENGGVPLYVESVIDRFQSTPNLRATGSLGEVMKESIDIAYTYVKQFLSTITPAGTKNDFFDVNSIHIHAPEGATPKDGPSAGITMITSLLSLATGKPVRPNLAMTGEITLTGKVIAVGGITEKMIAAKREGVKNLILPKDNKKELEDIPDFVKEGFTVYLVDYYKEVYHIAFDVEDPVTPIQPHVMTPRKKKDFGRVYPKPTTSIDDPVPQPPSPITEQPSSPPPPL
eukprot:gene1399-1615_t